MSTKVIDVDNLADDVHKSGQFEKATSSQPDFTTYCIRAVKDAMIR